MLIVALGMERREEDEDEETLHTNYRAKAAMRDLVKRGKFPSQYPARVI
jgi:hypothetical protein